MPSLVLEIGSTNKMVPYVKWIKSWNYFNINFHTNCERGAINPKVRNTNTELKTSEATQDKTKKPIISGKYFFRFI